MPTTFVDNFYVMDPYSPPPSGTSLTAVNRTVTDWNDNGYISSAGGDRINGVDIIAVYPGDTVTVRWADGSIHTVTGVTFYLANGTKVFSPIDGSTLQNATFLSSSWVYTNVAVTPSQMQLTVPCFTPGTLILTPTGQRPIESLQVGEQVSTMDNGAQTIRWIGRREVPGDGTGAPIRFMRGALGNVRDLVVSPQHRMLLSGWRAELLVGETEVLAAAKHLVNGDTIHFCPCETATYMHLMLDRHEVIFAEGIPTECFHAGDYMLCSDRQILSDLMGIFPDILDRKAPARLPARPVLKGREAAFFA